MSTTTRAGCSSFQVVKVGCAEADITIAVSPPASETRMARTCAVAAKAGAESQAPMTTPSTTVDFLQY